MVMLLCKIDIVKMIEIYVLEMMLVFKKLDKCWGKKIKYDISDILKVFFYFLK